MGRGPRCWSRDHPLSSKVLGHSFPGSPAGKEFACNAGDPGSIPRSGRSPEKGIGYSLQYSWASLVAQMVKNLPAVWEIWVPSLVGKIPWKREWLPTPVFWPGEFQGQRSLAGYSPWGCKQSDIIEQLSILGHSKELGIQPNYYEGPLRV